MSKLEDIGVTVETFDSSSGQIGAILCELQTRLNTLITRGRGDSIDLRSLPLFPGDYEQLKETLGYGEIHINLDAMGPSEIYETAIAGIWWLTHYNTEDEVVAEYIEIATLPELVKTDPGELPAAEQQLQRLIDNINHPNLDNEPGARHEPG
jgi:hydrogenase-1 operon protein HyaF